MKNEVNGSTGKIKIESKKLNKVKMLKNNC
jgi:hypothetical protein